jgi:poly-gamma-glutamate synthesis protein (capsule biosynthesis protein)
VETITLIAVGDISFGRGIEVVFADRGVNVFNDVRDIIQCPDIVFGNLESVLSEQGTAINKPDLNLLDGRVSKTVRLKGNSNAAQALAQIGFKILSLANNHVMDYGAIAVEDTVRILRNVGVKVTGIGYSMQEAITPIIITVKGFRLAFLSFSAFSKGIPQEGIFISPCDAKIVSRSIEIAKQSSDHVIVSFHWGMENYRYPFRDAIDLGRKAVDAGACLVVGHHPHVIQGIESYRNGIIAYSLGNFLFDSIEMEWRKAIALSCSLDAHGIREWQAVPLILNSDGCPRLASQNEKTIILSNLKLISTPVENSKDPIWIEIEKKNITNQAAWYWNRGFVGNLKRIYRFRLSHLRILWRVLSLLYTRYIQS